jgi:hypothetical protein
MPATVVAVGAAVGRGEWHGGGQVDVVAVGGRSTSEECPSVEAWGGGGVGPRRRLRTVRSSGVTGPRDSPVSGGRARLSELSIQQMGAVGPVCRSEGVSPQFCPLASVDLASCKYWQDQLEVRAFGMASRSFMCARGIFCPDGD